MEKQNFRIFLQERHPSSPYQEEMAYLISILSQGIFLSKEEIKKSLTSIFGKTTLKRNGNPNEAIEEIIFLLEEKLRRVSSFSSEDGKVIYFLTPLNKSAITIN